MWRALRQFECDIKLGCVDRANDPHQIHYLRGQAMKPPTKTIPRRLCQCGCGGEAPFPPYTHAARGWKRGEPLRYIHGHNRRTSRKKSYREGGHLVAYTKCGTAFIASLRDRKLIDGRGWILRDGYVISSQCLDSRALHRIIKPAPPGMRTDHKNRNRLDNRRSNLRSITHNGNTHNAKLRSDSTSGFRGVYRAKSHGRYTGKWKAEIVFQGRAYGLGVHCTKQDAARAYDKAALKFYGRFACTNAMLGLL